MDATEPKDGFGSKAPVEYRGRWVRFTVTADLGEPPKDFALGPQATSRGMDDGGVHSVISRTTRHGLPAANTPSGISLVTTLPAPITARGPIRTPGRMIAPPPTQTSDPISTGLPNSSCRRSSALNGCMGV